MFKKLSIFLVLLVALFSVTMVAAQEEQCAAVAQSAFAALNENCSAMGSSSICYAADGEVVSLSDAMQASTQPLDLDAEQWGMARLHVHGNVPLTVSEDGLVYLLIGDAQLENAVTPEEAFEPVQPIAVQTLVGSNLRSSPSTEAQVMMSAPVGAELMADGRTSDGAWVHVTYEDVVAWVSSQIVVPTDGDVSSLPVLGDNSRTLMQSFAFSNGTESSPCTDEPASMLIIQAPDGITADITVNGADIGFMDTIALRIMPEGDMQLVALGEGGATAGILSVPPGFSVSMPMSEGGTWTGLRPITDSERNLFLVLDLVEGDSIYKAVSVPTSEQVAATLQSVNRANAGAGQTVAASAAGGACGGFQPTSPLDGLAFGDTTFYWDGAQGATGYRVNVFTDGTLALSETVDAFSTTTTLNTGPGAIGEGSSYSWNVEALANGDVMCTSGSVTLLREASAQRAGGGDDGGDGGGDGGGDCTWCG